MRIIYITQNSSNQNINIQLFAEERVTHPNPGGDELKCKHGQKKCVSTFGFFVKPIFKLFGLCLVGLITGLVLRQTNIAQEVIVSLLDLLISIFTDIVWNPGYQLMSRVEEEEESSLKTGSRLALEKRRMAAAWQQTD